MARLDSLESSKRPLIENPLLTILRMNHNLGFYQVPQGISLWHTDEIDIPLVINTRRLHDLLQTAKRVDLEPGIPFEIQSRSNGMRINSIPHVTEMLRTFWESHDRELTVQPLDDEIIYINGSPFQFLKLPAAPNLRVEFGILAVRPTRVTENRIALASPA